MADAPLPDLLPERGEKPNFDKQVALWSETDRRIRVLGEGVGEVTDAGMAAVAESGGEFTAALTAQTVALLNSIGFTPGSDPAQNVTELQAAVDLAIAEGRDLYLLAAEEWDHGNGTVVVDGPVRIYGQGRYRTVIHQTAQTVPVFHVTGQDVVVENFGIRGQGLNFDVGVATFQDSNGIRIERNAHGFTARQLAFEDIYIGLMVRNFPESPNAQLTTPPTRLERLVVEDVIGKDVWAVLHGGPFDSPRVNDIRGNILPATGHADTNGHAPHLIYVSSPSPQGGVYTDGFFTRGGTFTGLSAWDGPNYIGAAFSFKWCRGIIADDLTARGYRGVVELQGVEDSTFGIVSSMEDKFPAVGSDATRASMSFSSCKRVRVKHLAVDFAAVDHGRALRFESTSSDCEVERLTVVERSTVDRRSGNPTGEISFAVHLQGANNTVRNADITNLGQPKWCAISVTSTGSRGRVINPRIGAGYEAHIRVAAAHVDAVLDYDPLYLVPDRTITSVRTVIDSPASRTVVRDRSIGQTLPPGFVDEFDRGVTVTGLAVTDDGKLWRTAGSGGGILNTSANWRVTNTTAKYIGGGAREAIVADGGSANGTMRTTIATTPTGELGGLAGRVTDWNNYIAVGFNHGVGDGKLNLYKRVGGYRTDVGQSAAGLAVAGAVVELVMSGNSVSVRVNGTQVIAPQTISDVSAVPTHGLMASSTETALTFDRAEFVAA
ncbi:MAG: hypothetical protein P1U38_09515 [Aeromicrobium sp.]|uniref:hypothetical protein n=1 Tax=Aeromicrobium sp. TaxID=1871063 RepID=UPI00260C57AD|nr:hypothetical protein [Aeromicrobium sp.]MDF1704998.1 hypothetical protein [Aeromicrobium sp.]